jgi:hypothetical protein
MQKTSDARDSQAWCLFHSADQPFAVRLECVSEIVPIDRLAWIPLSPPGLLGLCTIRRDVVPVVGLVEGALAASGLAAVMNAVLVLQAGQGTWGIGINREGIAVIEGQADDGQVEALPQETSWSAGGLRRGKTLHTIIHPERAWANFRALIVRWYGQVCERTTPSAPDAGSLDGKHS